jgi:hypothetical protein
MGFPTGTELGQHVRRLFPSSEWNEVIWQVYRMMSAVLTTADCDTWTITPTHFIWSRAGQPVNSFSIVKTPPQRLGYDAAFDRIIARDVLVQKYVQLIAKTHTHAIYRLLSAPASLERETEECASPTKKDKTIP